MKVQNKNSSSKRTKQRIKEAFAELMHEKCELANITVKELVSRAGITRSSFYTHYDNIYEVAGDIQNETIEILQMNLEEVKSINDFYHCIDRITDYIKENEHIYSMILTSPEAIIYADRIVKLLAKKLDIAIVDKKENNELTMIFYTYGCSNLLIKYFRKELDCSLDEIREYIKGLVTKIF